jgi:peptidoglycan/xylan/chitin deacetylase (PgdA/CDA1 family)
MSVSKEHPISPLGPVRLAVTVDDMTLFRGVPYAPGDDAMKVNRAFIGAFRNHGIAGVYQFSNSAPLEDDRALEKVYDFWVQNGHHVGNHTHHHPAIYWLDADRYAEDIDAADNYLGRWIRAAPKRCFRFCMDMWGDTGCKCDQMLEHLRQREYTPVPISIGFHDTRWNAAWVRTTRRGTPQEVQWLRGQYIDSAVHELRQHAANARAVFGRDPAHIWMLHGTSIAAASLEEILDRFAGAGVEFVALDEAMADPMNAANPPRVSPEFIHQVEKWALALGVPVDDRHSPMIEEIEKLHPAPGESALEISNRMRELIAQKTGAVIRPFPLSPYQ